MVFKWKLEIKLVPNATKSLKIGNTDGKPRTFMKS